MTFYNFYFYLVIMNRWNRLELLTSLKTIMFQLTEIEWCFEIFYFFFSLLEVNFVNRILIFSTVVCI